ncbi:MULTISPECIES: STM3941 family protein [unclassified Rhizobium]|uniref:STM3941 family protein n=1 Tax=unclassified Rhizobium TaxID=2613769 RepID=UPI000713B50A|nr:MULTISPECIES: STM3941 family protein [unclassified Rhizobium]KQS98190.1 hypothetical protein ASG50_23765 [Rhizobium sp. Leaf386]KQT00453.1 hypothetical protein ASG42_06355 [Rhizobium sp. Leaf391]KQT97456.1 hypothetical protein ASG68_11085 [Rhizobium sp. Leaf453]
MTDHPITIQRSKMKTAMLLLGAILFVAGSIWIAQIGYAEQGAGSFELFMGVIGALFFGACGILLVPRLFETKPVIEFTENGLIARDVSPNPIHWRDILAVRLVDYRKQPIIELLLSPEAEKTQQFTRTVRMTRSANRGLGFEGVCMSGAGLSRPPAEVVGLIGSWAEAFHARGTAPQAG